MSAQNDQEERMSINDSEQAHVDYILTAEFDVDAGPIISHQYPEPLGGDVSQMLAELMLPDQVHNREEDWTIFFLHKGPDEGEPEGEAGLMYVLSLVNKKMDQTAKRGAVVKAIAICTRHSFLHIYKPLLVLALEEYFISPTEHTLAHLFTSLNEMDLSQMPELNYLERTILTASDNKDLFREKFLQQGDEQTSPMSAHSRELSTDSKRRTFINLTSGNRFVPATIGPKDCHFFETKIIYTGRKIPIQIPVIGTPDIVGDFSVIRLVNCFSGPHLSSPQPFPLHPHLTTSGPMTHPIIILLNGLLTGKRIVFIGYGLPSGEVANFVLAACAIASGVNGMLRGITERAFPYTDLSKVDNLLDVPGYIAGVTNPLFENHPEWWDLLLNVDTGRIRISPQITPVAHPVPELFPTPPSTDPTGDIAFMEEIQYMIQNRISEALIRNRFKDWLWRFIRKAGSYEEMAYGDTIVGSVSEDGFIIPGHGLVWPDEATKMKEVSASQMRFEGWRGGVSYHYLSKDRATIFSTEIVRTMDVHHQVDRLRIMKNLTPDESALIYLALNSAIEDYDQIDLLLSALPVNHGGLTPLALGLFHPYQKVRLAVAELLHKVDEHPAGQHFITALNRFQKIAFDQVFSEAERPKTGNGTGTHHEILNEDTRVTLDELKF